MDQRLQVDLTLLLSLTHRELDRDAKSSHPLHYHQ